MFNLIRGDIRRMLKGKPFIICLAAVFCLSVWDTFDAILQRMVYEQLEETRPPDLFYNSFSNLMKVSIVVGLCTVFIIGWDLDGGNIKNKILAGYSKLKIYLSYLTVSFIFGLILLVLHYAVVVLWYGIGFGWSYIGMIFGDEWYSRLIVLAMIQGVFIIFYMAALTCMIMMISGKKLIGIILFAAVFVFGVYFGGDANAFSRAVNEQVIHTVLYPDGTEHSITEKNPYYLPDDDPLKFRSVIIDLIDAPYRSTLPLTVQTGSSLFDRQHPEILYYGEYLAGESVMVFVFGGLGYIVFKNRNLK